MVIYNITIPHCPPPDAVELSDMRDTVFYFNYL